MTTSTAGASSLDVVGGSADGATAETAVESVAASNFPDTAPTYELPDPWVGYQPAYGAAYSVQPASADGSTQTDQVVVVAWSRTGLPSSCWRKGRCSRRSPPTHRSSTATPPRRARQHGLRLRRFHRQSDPLSYPLTVNGVWIAFPAGPSTYHGPPSWSMA